MKLAQLIEELKEHRRITGGHKFLDFYMSNDLFNEWESKQGETYQVNDKQITVIDPELAKATGNLSGVEIKTTADPDSLPALTNNHVQANSALPDGTAIGILEPLEDTDEKGVTSIVANNYVVFHDYEIDHNNVIALFESSDEQTGTGELANRLFHEIVQEREIV